MGQEVTMVARTGPPMITLYSIARQGEFEVNRFAPSAQQVAVSDMSLNYLGVSGF